MIIYSDGTRSAMMRGVMEQIDAGAPEPATMFLYTAERAVPGAAIEDQVLCAQFQLSIPCGIVTAGTLELTGPFIDGNLAASGILNWGRIINGLDSWVCDFDVGLVEDDPEPEMKLSALVVFQGGIIKINSGVFSVPLQQ